MKYIVSILLLLTQYNTAFAGGCNLEEVEAADALASLHLAKKIRNQVMEMEKQMAKQGKDLKVVMVARSGESLKGLLEVKDDYDQSLEAYLVHLANLSNTETAEPKYNNRKSLPKSYYKKKGSLIYSHFGFFVKKSHLDPEANDWNYAYHLLAECDGKKKRYGNSGVQYEPFQEFFWGSNMLKKEKKSPGDHAMIVVPSQKIQDHLVRHFAEETSSERLIHQPRYNVIAAPFKFLSYRDRVRKKPELNSYHQLVDQNSNQWPLEILAAASQPYGTVRSREAAQTVLMKTNYHPSIVRPIGTKEFNACGMKKFKIGPLKLWDATNLINCQDQSYKSESLMQVITVESVVRYLERQNWMETDPVVVRADKSLMRTLRPLLKKKNKTEKNIQRVRVALKRHDYGAEEAKIMLGLIINKELKVKRSSNRRRR